MIKFRFSEEYLHLNLFFHDDIIQSRYDWDISYDLFKMKNYCLLIIFAKAKLDYLRLRYDNMDICILFDI